MAGILDYFYVSPGDRKRAEMELQNKIRLDKAAADIEKRKALEIRDSNQLNSDFQKHRQERELQDTLSQMYPSNNPNLTADQNDTLAMIHASDKMNEIKAAAPLSATANEMQNVEEKAAQQPVRIAAWACSVVRSISWG